MPSYPSADVTPVAAHSPALPGPRAGTPLAGRMFAALHDRKLVYNACWEDPALDRQALGLGPGDHVLVITSGGCNALDYLLAGAGRVTAVDVNPRQNALLELKAAGVRRLSHAEFFELFGAGRSVRAREMYRDALRADLSPFAQRYWDGYIDAFAGRGWRNSFYYRGTSGFLAKGLMLFLRRFQGLGPHLEELLAAPTLAQQRHIYESRLRDKLWSAARLASQPLALNLAGVPPEQRREIAEEYAGGTAQLVHDGFDAIFGRLPIADNYFWRAYITGSYTATCCPEYLKAANFPRLRDALPRLDVRTTTVTGFLTEARPRPDVSKFVLLDHMDWMGWRDQPALAEEWQAILDAARPGARVIYRSAGLRTRYLDPVRVVHEGRTRRLTDLLHRHPELAARLHEQDRVHTYGSFHIADLP
ncbi:DUF3419 family protein [Streptomyces sp. CB03234]|uniref:DUF3419 family protein n=1 Tax=Streptomyces sp. (strain CB03234) TaxID=1703937 RepID=UPI0009A13FF2|nr:BtaA family protein [Streptomyces sp. CB03234]